MLAIVFITVGLAALGNSQITTECTANQVDIEAVAQVVFTYGRETSEETQTAIAFTVLNRITDPNFPNSTLEVVNWEHTKRGRAKRVYAKVTKPWFVRKWNQAKNSNSAEYQTTLRLSRDVLCGQTDDPTDGATDFAGQPTPRMFHAPRNFRARELGVQVGDLYFFKIGPGVSGNVGGRGGGRGNSGGRGGDRGNGGGRPGRPGGRRPGGHGPGGHRPGGHRPGGHRPGGRRPGGRPGRGRGPNRRRHDGEQ